MSFTPQLECFPALYQRLKKPIHQYVLRTVHDGETAAELTQDVFLKAYRARDTFETQRSFTTWLWTIARNTVCDWHRRNANEPLRAIVWISPDGTESESPCENIASPALDAEALIAERGDQQELLRKLKCLTKLQRKVLWLRIIRGLSYEEISKRLGLSISAAKCAFYRARLTLVQPREPAFAT